MMIAAPARRPCSSCPYRCDVPSGVWDQPEYAKLEAYDGETGSQPPSVFLCHLLNRRLCAGWVAVHDMDESLGLRIAVLTDLISPATAEKLLDYTTDVELHESGAAARAYGMRDISSPGSGAIRIMVGLEQRVQ